MNLDSKLELNNGVKIPVLGLGTLNAHGESLQKAILWATEAGYRHIDTAKAYGNEKDVGEAIKKSGLPRDELFITTKLWNDDHGYDNTLKAIDQSLRNLQMDYVDLYLIHWPVSGRRVETWKAMNDILGKEKARAIGVSNFTSSHIQELLEDSDVVPAVNQIEFTPYLYQKDLHSYCKSKGIEIEAWSPLTHGVKLNDPNLVKIANKYEKSTAQVLIRWNLQHQNIVIPKSEKKEHIIDNTKVFDFTISNEDMERLNALNEDLRTSGWDPYSDKFK